MMPTEPDAAQPRDDSSKIGTKKWVKIVLIVTGIYLLWKLIKFILRNFVPYYWKN